jgi:hypothetical protein
MAQIIYLTELHNDYAQVLPKPDITIIFTINIYYFLVDFSFE